MKWSQMQLIWASLCALQRLTIDWLVAGGCSPIWYCKLSGVYRNIMIKQSLESKQLVKCRNVPPPPKKKIIINWKYVYWCVILFIPLTPQRTKSKHTIPQLNTVLLNEHIKTYKVLFLSLLFLDCCTHMNALICIYLRSSPLNPFFLVPWTSFLF